MVDRNKCISCGACISICPVEAIKFVDGKAHINPKKCIHCGSCQQFCPVGAIDLNKSEDSENAKPTKQKK